MPLKSKVYALRIPLGMTPCWWHIEKIIVPSDLSSRKKYRHSKTQSLTEGSPPRSLIPFRLWQVWNKKKSILARVLAESGSEKEIPRWTFSSSNNVPTARNDTIRMLKLCLLKAKPMHSEYRSEWHDQYAQAVPLKSKVYTLRIPLGMTRFVCSSCAA